MAEKPMRIVIWAQGDRIAQLKEVQQQLAEEGFTLTLQQVGRHLMEVGYKHRMRNADYRLSSEPQSGG